MKKILKAFIIGPIILGIFFGCSIDVNKPIETEKQKNISSDDKELPKKSPVKNQHILYKFEYWLNGTYFNHKSTSYYYYSNSMLLGILNYVLDETGIHKYTIYTNETSGYNRLLSASLYDRSFGFAQATYKYDIPSMKVTQKIYTGAITTYSIYDYDSTGYKLNKKSTYTSSGALQTYLYYYYNSTGKVYAVDYYDTTNICYGYYYYTYNSDTNEVSKIEWYARNSNGNYILNGYSTIFYGDEYILNLWYNSANQNYAYDMYYLDMTTGPFYDPFDPTLNYNL